MNVTVMLVIDAMKIFLLFVKIAKIICWEIMSIRMSSFAVDVSIPILITANVGDVVPLQKVTSTQNGMTVTIVMMRYQ